MTPFGNVRSPGIQSYALRHFKDNAEVARKARELGFASIELCAVHADFQDVRAFEAVTKIYAAAGVAIGSLGVQTFTGDEAKERKWFECARLAGAGFLTAHFNVDTFPEAVPVAMRLSDEFGVKLAIHCHGGFRFGGSLDILQHLLKISGPQIGICIDTAWCHQIGNADPARWIRTFGSRMYGMHYKDFVYDRSGRWTDVVIGTGNLRIQELFAALDEVKFAGHAVIEYEGDLEKPEPALKACLEQVRNAG